MKSLTSQPRRFIAVVLNPDGLMSTTFTGPNNGISIDMRVQDTASWRPEHAAYCRA